MVMAWLTLLGAYLQLYNDSTTYLYVRVFGADGTMLAETSVAPQDTNIYSDQYKVPGNNPTQSQTPYVVHWYCQANGVDYSICTGVADGALVTAESCSGARQCPQKKVPGPSDFPQGYGEGFKNPPDFPPPDTASPSSQ